VLPSGIYSILNQSKSTYPPVSLVA
jgi:hypothetical protein